MFLDNTGYGSFSTFLSTNGNNGAFLIMQPGGNAGFHLTISGEKGPTGSMVLKFNTWYSVWGTYDGATITYYLFDLFGNLLETATASQSGAFTGNTDMFLAYDNARGYHMKMKASSIMIAHAAFSQADIQTFIRTRTLSTVNQALTYYWKLNDGSGAVIANTLGGVNGTTTGSPSWDSGVPIPNRMIAT